MTQEEKELLLKDLCARLPYGVEVEYNSISCEVLSIDKYNEELTIRVCPGYSPIVKLENVKPYLFPLSSMTKEKIEELLDIVIPTNNGSGVIEESNIGKYMDWCYKNHIDINDLLPKDLAIDATGLNIY